MAGGLQTQIVYSSSTTEFMYHLLVTSAHVFSSTIMITSLLDILVGDGRQGKSMKELQKEKAAAGLWGAGTRPGGDDLLL